MPILSPPTVSPLSTPAATNVNVDEGLPDEVMAKLAADLPPLSLTRDASMFRSDIFGPQQSGNAKGTPIPEAMEIDEPYGPEETNFHRRDQLQAIATTDPDPHAAEYSSHGMLRNMRLSQGSIDPSAYMMNLAAQATLFHDHGPPVIDPSAVSLHSLTQDSEAFTGSGGPASVNDSQKLESFAKIEFADSTFQMTTYAVIIGRDQQAMAQARADERREAIYRRKCEENERNGLPPPTPVMHDRGKFSKSYVSEEGGMLGPEHSDGEDMKPVKKRRQSSVAQYAPGEDNVAGDHVQSNRQYVSHTPGAAAVDMSVLQPSPGHIPFIGIHSPGPDIASKTRGISRQHLKIQFNKKRGVFEGIALHKNGFFCEDILYGLDTPATLRSGDRLQIKDVEFFFVINGVQIGMSGGEDEDITSSKRMSIGGKEMSLDFEHSDHENFRDTSEELSDVENIPTPNNEFESSDGEPEQAPAPAPAPTSVAVEESRLKAGLDATAAQPVNEGEQPPEIVKTENEIPAGMSADIPHEFAIPDIPRRRGPGRPPKDGIMSKRERRLLKKQMQETSKKALPQDPQEEKIKRPVGRPRKNPLPEDGEQPEKRKYNKKKREDGDGGSDVEKRIKEKKDKKVRPKSPPLDLRREDYTAEQLQKPTKNYGVLIDEALTNGPPDGLTLKQIYKRITAKYPWFFFTAETKGWESSVRHNLIGNEAFKKDEETGLWSRVPGVELDAGKKRKVSSPDRHLGPSHLHPHLSHSPYYQTSPYANPGNISYAHGLPSYSAEQKHLQPGYTSLGQNTQLHATTSQPVAQPVYTAHAPAPAQLPASYASLGLSRPSSTPQQSTYSSPYARPPPPTNPPAKADANLANSQNPIASTTPATSAQQPQPKLNAASTGPREQLTPEIERAIVQFSANMLEVISERTPHAASIIEAAANRIRGLPVQNRVPGFESDMKRSHHNAAASSPAPSPAPPNTVEAEIQRRLRNFRESMVTALKTKTDKAEIVVDSAINRARGLPHAGKIPGWEEADNLMVKSVTQIIAEARSAYNLNSSRTAPSLPAQSVLRREAPATSASALTASTSSAAPVPPTNGTPATPHAASVHPSISGVPNSHSMARPGLPLQRPAPVALTRAPTAGPIARPTTVLHKEPTTTPAIVSAATLSTVADDAFHKNHGVSNTTNNHTSSNTSVSSNVVNNSCNNITNNPSVTKVPPSGPTPSSMTGTTVGKEVGNITSTTTVSAASATALKMPAPIPKVSSPAPPSAGVVDQIAGQKRSIDEGPGSANEEQPEPKRLGVPLD
ncbi:hypothetical protein GGS21DRAFT_537841 [Xylaria nigripes]|nr:hypothetical protein GGS21DRAFT_537841 [Xylaria nigripes]